jgi:hypothetical protein
MITPLVPGLDAERLKESLEALSASLAAEDDPPTEALLIARRAGQRTASLLLKRTYAVEQGRCVLVPDADQAPLFDADLPVAPDLPAPFVSPLLAANEQWAMKPGTDLVIQADACPTGDKTRKMTVSVRFGKHLREITVYGDRRGEYDAMGRPRFSEPEPIEDIPLRWDRAYGGFDRYTCEKSGYIEILQQILRRRPDWDAARATPFHYPRNPAGRGYLMTLDEGCFKGLRIPNLEHPGALLTPERLAVGSPLGWLKGALPAAWDYQDPTWFPRCAYLGLTPRYAKDGAVPAEVKRGWATEDLLSIPSLLKVKSPGELRLEHGQVAAPGMVFFDIAPDETFVLSNLYPDKPTHSITLPGEVPAVAFELSPGKFTDATIHLHSVVLRVPARRVEVVWSARAPLPPSLADDDVPRARRTVRWDRPAEKG